MWIAWKLYLEISGGHHFASIGFNEVVGRFSLGDEAGNVDI
jgi:hypothetical protein